MYIYVYVYVYAYQKRTTMDKFPGIMCIFVCMYIHTSTGARISVCSCVS